MNKALILVILAIILILGITTIYAEEHELNPIVTIYFDHQNYFIGDTIVISGNVDPIIESSPITLVQN